ncbi:hypothetical protein C474_10024 [Halogeometricum pallidum JCM 14848]|uniref:DUF7344 domain-containing protein n=1 Tax=Halogeometricum pallidum JCM 14848 TaxID=1227487 RepID=M0DAG8_HALPD|nr:hypothetical protein [Halogeometricum pallidum]ELZ31164.1 hypothetical protein C474_10024 [Halogeometricum pallidum JCM 14848]
MGREDIGVLYEMLSTERRRRALAVLTDAEEPLGREELARRIVARRRTADAGGVEPDGTRKTDIEISLGHIHLPKLESGGVVERTAEGKYDATPLGCDLRRAAQAFETSLDADAREIEGTASPTNRSDAVPASEADDGR